MLLPLASVNAAGSAVEIRISRQQLPALLTQLQFHDVFLMIVVGVFAGSLLALQYKNSFLFKRANNDPTNTRRKS
jgi:hypothetical protein